MLKENKYTEMQRRYYDSNVELMKTTGNHRHHDANQDYWNVLLGVVKENPVCWDKKSAFDFGCGQGRNIVNLLRLANWDKVDGCDLSEGNLNYSKQNIEQEYGSMKQTTLFHTDGTGIGNVASESYDFVMSTIVMQHICVYSIRFQILQEKYRILRREGILSFQMGYDKTQRHYRDYKEDFLEAEATNGMCDVTITNPQLMVDDLVKIGFRNIEYKILPSFSDSHEQWIYFQCQK